MSFKTIRTILILVTTGLFIAFTALLFAWETRPRALSVYGEVGDFALVDSRGQSFGTEELENKVWVADFIFTTCGGICPRMSANMAKLHRSYKLEDDVEFVSISVNPEQDTPQALEAYAQKFDADPASWHFLTGSREAITDLAVNRFKIGSVEEPIMHSAKFVLVDRNGNVRGYYEGTEEEDLKTLFRDLAHLRRER